MVLAMGFGIRLRRRLLRLADLPVRRGQVASGLRDVLPRLRQIGLGLRERLIRRVKTSLIRLNVLLRLRQLRGVIPQSLLVGGEVLVEPVQIVLGDRAGDRDRRAHAPIRLVA